MESEVSSITKLGIVLISLAVLIALAFGIFQIAKSSANDGVVDVQQELDGVSKSQFSAYDGKTVTGTMVNSALEDFEGESCAILIATQTWKNLLANTGANVGDHNELTEAGAGLKQSYIVTKGSDASGKSDTSGISLPVVWAYKDKALSKPYVMSADGDSNGESTVNGAFINYNTILGAPSIKASENPAGTTDEKTRIRGVEVCMGGVYFDNNCYRCSSGFANTEDGKPLANNITANLNKVGRVEHVPNAAKFEAHLIKDGTGTTIGIVFEQISK